MLHRCLRTAFAGLIVTGSATLSVADIEAAQIRTVDIPPSLPVPIAPPSESALPEVTEPEPSDRLQLELPTIDEARAIDANEAADLAEPVDWAPELSAEAVARAIAAAEDAMLRAANAEQLAAARLQLDRIATDKQAQRDRLARYREAEAAHAAAMVDYRAQVEAARLARERWERDVVACQAGDRNRCGPPVAPN